MESKRDPLPDSLPHLEDVNPQQSGQVSWETVSRETITDDEEDEQVAIDPKPLNPAVPPAPPSSDEIKIAPTDQ